MEIFPFWSWYSNNQQRSVIVMNNNKSHCCQRTTRVSGPDKHSPDSHDHCRGSNHLVGSNRSQILWLNRGNWMLQWLFPEAQVYYWGTHFTTKGVFLCPLLGTPYNQWIERRDAFDGKECNALVLSNSYLVGTEQPPLTRTTRSISVHFPSS